MSTKKEERLKITHNKKLFWAMIFLIIVLIILFFYIKKEVSEEKECNYNSDCAPSGCCHPESCVSQDNAPECTGAICTMVCSGPLDCGAGQCGCVSGKCQVIKTK